MDLETSRIIAFVTSIALTFGFYAQVIKMWWTKSAKDFSWMFVLALTLDEMAWLNYGWWIRHEEWPVFVLPLVNTPAIIGMMLGFIRYRKGGDDREKNNGSSRAATRHEDG